mgnify:FL=1|nr:MAG TPA: DNA primase [Herelleviridae sp.]
MGKVDVKKLKKALTLSHYDTILRELGIPIFSKSNTEWRCWTGDKNKDPYQGSPALVFYTDTKIFFGMTMGRSYDCISLVQTRLNLLGQTCSFLDACNWILEKTGLDPTKITKPLTNNHVYDWSELERFVRVRKYGNQLPEYNRNIIDTLPLLYPQAWIDEGISEETMAKYQIRYYERCNQTVIPCFDDEARLVGVRVRNWDKDRVEQAKYMPLITLDGQCYKFNTNQVFYGINYNKPEIERTGRVIIVESEKAVMKLDTYMGRHNIALGMYGSNLGIQRRNQLIKMGVNTVSYVVDNDFIGQDDEFFEQWREKIQHFIKLWDGFCRIEIVWDNLGLLGPKENATDRTKEVWEQLWENREIIE